MNNIITISIIGLYTLIYCIVFYIQRAEIKRMKSINDTMNTYMSIFKIDEVKKYVELQNENTRSEAANFIVNDKKVSETVKRFIDEHTDFIYKSHIESIDEKIIEQRKEMVFALFEFIEIIKKEDTIP